MTPPSSEKRLKRLAAVLLEAGVDVFVANRPVTMGYLHGLFEESHERFLALLVRPGQDPCLICPALTETAAKEAGLTHLLPWKDGEDPYALLQTQVEAWGLRSGIFAVDDDLPSHMLLAMQDALPAALFRAGGALLSQIQQIKEEPEIVRLKAAARIADEAFEATLPQLRAGMREAEVQSIVQQEMRARGGKPTFCIVASGPHAAMPHHLTEERAVQPGEILLMDFGCEVEGYQSDITRTVCCGAPSKQMREVYSLVFQAHHAARGAIRPEATFDVIDRAARETIERGGYGAAFVHRTGHGVGMSLHERPEVRQGNLDPCCPGQCFSIEPGIYLAGTFGVRIENIVLATETGHESLNAEPASELLSFG